MLTHFVSSHYFIFVYRCYKCAAVDRKKAGVKQFLYYTVKPLWRNCFSLDPITNADLYSALSPYGEVSPAFAFNLT